MPLLIFIIDRFLITHNEAIRTILETLALIFAA